MSRRIAHVNYDQAGEGERIKNHAMVEGLEDDFIKRIRRTYGHEPQSVTYKARGGLWLDAGGMMMTDQPVVVCRLTGEYAVRYKLEHAPFLAMELQTRIGDLTRRRTYGNRECVTLYMRFRNTVFPIEDALRVLKHLKKNASRGLEVGQARRAELALVPNLHIPDVKVGEA